MHDSTAKVTFIFFARAHNNNLLRCLSSTYTESSMTRHDDGFTPSLFAASRNLVQMQDVNSNKQRSIQDAKDKNIVTWKQHNDCALEIAN